MRERKKKRAGEWYVIQVNYYVSQSTVGRPEGPCVLCREVDNEMLIKQKLTSTDQLCQRATLCTRLDKKCKNKLIRKQNNKVELNFALMPIFLQDKHKAVCFYKKCYFILTESPQVKSKCKMPIYKEKCRKLLLCVGENCFPYHEASFRAWIFYQSKANVTILHCYIRLNILNWVIKKLLNQ